MKGFARLAWAAPVVVLAACFGGGDVLVGDGGTSLGDADADDSRDAGPANQGGGSEGGGRTGGPSCLFSQVTAELSVSNIDKVDLLFVVDNSGSMREEQERLRREFPRLLQILATGDTDDDGLNDFPPARDLHLGVVSSDMGLVGIQGIVGCEGLGDDGILANQPASSLPGCQAAYPPFLTYNPDVGAAEVAANDLGCIASLGTDGCGFEQPLEAALKALWPSVDLDPNSGEVYQPNRIQFLADQNGFGALGHGDVENAGFLRNNAAEGLSLIAIIVVTDEEDCSSRDTAHFTPDLYLDPNDPLAQQDLDLRCFYNPQNLYSLDRYVNGFQALRPGDENLVVFAGIVGVPPDLIDHEVDLRDEGARQAYYDRMLADPRMIETPDPNRSPEVGGNLIPSCALDQDGDGEPETLAFPPRRLVEVARRLGPNGVIESICQDDFAPAIDGIIDAIRDNLGAVCLPRPLSREADGLVACEVRWELPPAAQALAGIPTECDQLDFLSEPDGDPVSARGGRICRVDQLPVRSSAGPGGGEGWYYDDFSHEVLEQCAGSARQRIGFTAGARPPGGVTVRLDCQSATVGLEPESGPPRPRIGDACESDSACIAQGDGSSDERMFCHPLDGICVRQCRQDADCPEQWQCDDSDEVLSMTSSSDRPNGVAVCDPVCEQAYGVNTAVADVGRACLPESVPSGGYDDRESYVETSNEACGGGACLVFRLRGDPREGCTNQTCDPTDPDCQPSLCASLDEVRNRIYCSCRCDGPDGCGCPSGFSCVEALPQGPAEVRGSYCVRNGTFTR